MSDLYEWVMYMNESSAWTSHLYEWVIYMNESSEWMSDLYEWVIYMNESCIRMNHLYERVIRSRAHVHIWMSHRTHMNESCHTCEWVMSHLWMSHRTHKNEATSAHMLCCILMTHSYVCNDSFICVQWLIHICTCVRNRLQTFLDGYCSTPQGLLDWFEVDLGFTELFFNQIDLCVLVFFLFSTPVSHSPLVLFLTSCTASPARWECL